MVSAACLALVPSVIALRAFPWSAGQRRLNITFIGQSNLSGRGFLADLVGHIFALAHMVKIYGNNLKWRDGAEPVDDSTDQIDFISNDYITVAGGVGVGPCMACGSRLASLLPNTEIGLVNCAVGATSSTQWAPSYSTDKLYGLALAKTKTAAERGEIAALVIGQGHSDAMTDYTTANTWDTRMAAIIASFRADVGNPDLPVVISIMEPSPGMAAFPHWDVVRAAQLRLSGANIVHVSEAGLDYRTDHPDQRPHFTTAGQLEYGVRIADALYPLLAA